MRKYNYTLYLNACEHVFLDVSIRNPDNPAKLNDAKLISYEFEANFFAVIKFVNHPGTKLIEEDIRNLSAEIFPYDIDGIIGGSPCQS